jgi:hypothetical protein
MLSPTIGISGLISCIANRNRRGVEMHRQVIGVIEKVLSEEYCRHRAE